MNKTIESFPNYTINIDGTILNTKHNRIIHPKCIASNGYVVTTLRRDDGTKKRFYVHRLIALSHIPNPNSLPFINHIDGNKSNNNIDNLEWCTSKQNISHAWSIGLNDNIKLYNSVQPKSKFQEMGRVNRKYSKEDILDIRKLFGNKTMTKKELSIKYETTSSNIGRIIRKERYSDIE